jgi:hypothetical protein
MSKQTKHTRTRTRNKNTYACGSTPGHASVCWDLIAAEGAIFFDFWIPQKSKIVS